MRAYCVKISFCLNYKKNTVKYRLFDVTRRFPKVSIDIGADALEKEAEDVGEAPLYNPDQYLIDAGWQKWSDLFEKMVQACAYPGKPQARISIDSHDAIVGRKYKKDEGKGCRAFLNVLVLFSLMKRLETDGTYRPGLMVLDSPILSLKEKKANFGITEKDKADPGKRGILIGSKRKASN